MAAPPGRAERIQAASAPGGRRGPRRLAAASGLPAPTAPPPQPGSAPAAPARRQPSPASCVDPSTVSVRQGWAAACQLGQQADWLSRALYRNYMASVIQAHWRGVTSRRAARLLRAAQDEQAAAQLAQSDMEGAAPLESLPSHSHGAVDGAFCMRTPASLRARTPARAALRMMLGGAARLADAAERPDSASAASDWTDLDREELPGLRQSGLQAAWVRRQALTQAGDSARLRAPTWLTALEDEGTGALHRLAQVMARRAEHQAGCGQAAAAGEAQDAAGEQFTMRDWPLPPAVVADILGLPKHSPPRYTTFLEECRIHAN